MMPIEVFNRFEHKYLIDSGTYRLVTRVMDAHMKLDAYNTDGEPYTITNFYYDTADDYLIRKSLSSPIYKEKLRLRSYGVPNADTKVFLEIKKKVGGLVNKRRSVMLLDEAYRFAETGKAPKAREYMNGQVLRELEYFMSVYRPIPKLYLAYDRVAYFERGSGELRISFDKNIRSRRSNTALENGDDGRPLLDGDMYLMEIKTSRAKPLWLTKALTEFGIQRSSFSKYGTEYTRYVREMTEKEDRTAAAVQPGKAGARIYAQPTGAAAFA